MAEVDDDTVRTLLGAPPEQFLQLRAEFATRAKESGDAAAAREIAKLRKPTVAAWIVNALALADDTVITRAADLGDRLRAAQHALDATLLRELSAERRALTAELTAAAAAHADRTNASTTLLDEIRGTFDAAVADPDVTPRLGRLQRAESFSGFGFGDATGPPQLTLVRGGRPDDSAPSATATSAKPSAKAPNQAARQTETEALSAARAAADEADAAVGQARTAEKRAEEQVRQAERALTEAKDALAGAKAERDRTRDTHRTALARRREARRARDRAAKDR